MAVASGSSPFHLSSLSATARVHLAQAVFKFGQDWPSVSSLLLARPGQDSARYTPQFCATAYGEMLLEDGLDLTNVGEPNSRAARKLARKAQEDRKIALVGTLWRGLEEQTLINQELNDIRAGKWDDKIIDSLIPAAREALIAPGPTPKPRATSSGSPAPAKAPAKPKRGRRNKGMEADADGEGTPDDELEGGESHQSTPALPDLALDSEPTADSEGDVVSIKGRPSTATGRRKGKKVVEEVGEDEEGSEVEGETVRLKGRQQDLIAESKEDEEDEEGETEEEEIQPTKRKPRAKKPTAASIKKSSSRKRRTSEPVDEATASAKKRLKTEELGDGEQEERDNAARLARFKRGMTGVMKNMTDFPNAAAFLAPVKPSDAPGYEVAVKRQMCLREISSKVRTGAVTSAGEVQRDVALICANAVMFNDPDLDVVRHARELWEYFGQQLQLFLATHQAQE